MTVPFTLCKFGRITLRPRNDSTCSSRVEKGDSFEVWAEHLWYRCQQLSGSNGNPTELNGSMQSLYEKHVDVW